MALKQEDLIGAVVWRDFTCEPHEGETVIAICSNRDDAMGRCREYAGVLGDKIVWKQVSKDKWEGRDIGIDTYHVESAIIQ